MSASLRQRTSERTVSMFALRHTRTSGPLQRLRDLADAINEALREWAECSVFQREKPDGLFCRWQFDGQSSDSCLFGGKFQCMRGQHGQEMACCQKACSHTVG